MKHLLRKLGISNQRASLLTTLIFLTLLSLLAQIAFFTSHFFTANLIDSLVNSSIGTEFFQTAILVPILFFVLIQLCAYILFIALIWFLASSLAELFRLSAYWLGIVLWLSGNLLLFTLNSHYFPHSFFAHLFPSPLNNLLLILSATLLTGATLASYYHVIVNKAHRVLGSLFLIGAAFLLCLSGYQGLSSRPIYHASAQEAKPNIIFIGLDSLRPDFTGYFKHPSIHTPTIDHFLKESVVFTDAYSPLARTFPAWVSILTGKYPKHNHARNNLSSPQAVLANDNLAKRLRQAGYETIYATDEKRFSNITPDYGFDRVIGPSMGLNDFIIGSAISDFPLTNLLVNLPFGSFLFPFNYGNRASNITYEPDSFSQLLKTALNQRSGKPLFLSVHFCLTHWPYTWANDKQKDHFTQADRYLSAVERVDRQFAEFWQLLTQNGLLEKSVVVLLSDHGTTLGLPRDRVISQENYRGDPKKMKWVPVFKTGTTFSFDTSYGQGTDLLSLKQNQVLLAIRGFGMDFLPHHSQPRASLLDLAPTILSLLKLPPLSEIDGKARQDQLYSTKGRDKPSPPFYLETGHSFAEIETGDIVVQKVLDKTIGLYDVNPKTGFVIVKPSVDKSIIESKQRGVLAGNWLLVRIPDTLRVRLANQKEGFGLERYVLPAYIVLVNLKTGQWTVGLDTPLAKTAPLAELKRYFNDFYGDELRI